MSHLGVIQSYPGGSHDLRFLWPWTKRHAGFNDVLVTGPKGTWHPPEAAFFECGRDAYVDGEHLPKKLVDSVEAGLRMFPQATWITVEEYDCWHPRDFVRSVPEGVMCGLRCGGQIQGCESHFYMHWPVSATRVTWERWPPFARMLLNQRRYELGTPDAFLALACEVAGIAPKFDCWHGFSRNTIHGLNPANPNQPDFLPAARQAYLDGAVAFHGVKSSTVYGCSVERTVHEILKP